MNKNKALKSLREIYNSAHSVRFKSSGGIDTCRNIKISRGDLELYCQFTKNYIDAGGKVDCLGQTRIPYIFIASSDDELKSLYRREGVLSIVLCTFDSELVEEVASVQPSATRICSTVNPLKYSPPKTNSDVFKAVYPNWTTGNDLYLHRLFDLNRFHKLGDAIADSFPDYIQQGAITPKTVVDDMFKDFNLHELQRAHYDCWALYTLSNSRKTFTYEVLEYVDKRLADFESALNEFFSKPSIKT